MNNIKKISFLLSIMFLFTFIPHAQAAITTSTGTASGYIASTPKDITVNVPLGSNPVLFVAIGGSTSVTSVSYGGANLTKLWDQPDGAGVTRSSAWILVNPATGNNALHVVWSSIPSVAEIWAQPFYGVAQGDTQGTTWKVPVFGNGNSTMASQTISSAQAGDLIIDVITDYNQIPVTDGSQSLLFQNNAPGGTYLYWGVSSKVALGATVMQWTMPSTYWALGAVALIPASATPSDITPPSTPTGLSATAVSSSQINLSWIASTDNIGVTGYKIYRNGSQIITTSNTNYSDAGLSPSTSYSYTVSAYDAAGNNSSQSTGASATTQAPAPTPPTISSFTSNPSTITSGQSSTLSWSVSNATSLSISSIGTITGSSQSVSPTITTTYTLTATNATGQVTANTTVTVAQPDTTAPSIPTNLSATAVSSSQINLSWNASTDNVGVTGYKIYRAGTQIGTSATNSYSDSSLLSSTNYSYTVSAYDAAGNTSEQSSVTSATTQAQQTNTINASSCSQSAVQTAINSAQNGYTVNVPAGTCSWSGNVQITNKSISVIGAGQGNTNINGYGFALDNSPSRISGFTFNQTGSYMLIQGSRGFRFDHNILSRATWDFAMLVAGSLDGTLSNNPSEGLMDHNNFTNARLVMYGEYNDTGGQNRWSEPLNLGTSHNIYIEDNSFTSTQSCIDSGAACNAIDDNAGGRYVARFNTLNGAYFEAHSSSAYLRGNRLVEIYNNTLTPPNVWRRPLYMAAGTGMIFHNLSMSAFQENHIDLYNLRSTENTQPAPFGMCDGTRYMDGNLNGQHGYPCRDQIGRGGDISQWANSFGSPAPTQTLAPVYVWQNISGGSTQQVAIDSGNSTESTYHILENRDFYNYNPNFNGTSGVGEGTLVNRPTTCTTGVGYWATDQGEWNSNHAGADGQLYTCTSANTWSLYYKPYPYPFPLLANGMPDMNASSGTSVTYTLTSSSSTGGTITPSGITTVNSGSSQTFTITPNSGYMVSSLLVDGVNQATSTTYTFNNVTNNHTISVSFSLIQQPDTTAPSIPTNLTATIASSTQINLSWSASTDPIVSGQVTSGVVGYKIYRNGSLLATANSLLTTYSDTNLFSSTSYTYTVAAYDAANNTSGLSSPASATTPSGTAILGDLNLDHIVNTLDYSLMNSKWFQSYPSYDLTGDNLINTLDYAILKSNWGKTW